MKQVDAIKRGTFDRTIPISVREDFRGALECNGNGLCFNFDVKSPMCPSMKITGQRIHSPKRQSDISQRVVTPTYRARGKPSAVRNKSYK